jgi:hypothetical protein
MAAGLYLVGGETPHSGSLPVSGEYRTLFVVAVPWTPIENGWNLIPALELSCNNEDRHIVSKLVLRPTTHETDANCGIGSIETTTLLDDISELQLEENNITDLPIGMRNFEGVQVQVERILHWTNNLPNIDVVGYVHSGEKRPVQLADVQIKLRDAFVDEDNNPYFVNGGGKGFTWQDIRFGALESSSHPRRK